MTDPIRLLKCLQCCIVAERYPRRLLMARREKLLECYRHMTEEQRLEAIGEMAEMEGSDNTLGVQLSDAGYGSGGVM